MENFVTVSKLTKKYGELCAVDNLSFTVKEGEIFGFLGPNGAGKSTTLHVLTTLTDFDRGDIRVGGYDMRRDKDRIKGIIGMVPQEIAVYEKLSAYENVRFFASLYGLRGKKLKDASMEALNFVGLSDHAKERVGKMSGGMKRRINIACGIVHNPKLIVMDEPTVGVDPQSREHILGSIHTLRKRGATVIYTSHYMPEVQEICDRIAIIDKGRLAACGTEEELVSLVVETKLILLKTRFPQGFDTAGLQKELPLLPEVRRVLVREDQIELEVPLHFTAVESILKRMMDAGLPVLGLEMDSPTLETTFLALTGHDLR